MKRKMDYEELKDFFQDGIVTDLMYAIRHYFIWRTIGENYDQIKSINNDNFDNLLGELQSSAHDLAIIRLSKIFDNRSNKYQIRCITELLEIEPVSTVQFPLRVEYYAEFYQITKLFPKFQPSSVIDSPLEFIELFKGFLENDELKSKINKLKFVRNKTLAHNEHGLSKYNFESDDFWNDYLILLNFVKSFISLFGTLFLQSDYWQFSFTEINEIHFTSFSELYWLIKQLEEKIGKDKIVQWWV